jgi:hypothetical protein
MTLSGLATACLTVPNRYRKLTHTVGYETFTRSHGKVEHLRGH